MRPRPLTLGKNTGETEQQDVLLRDFFVLLKPKVMSLVVFTGFAGMWVAPGFAAMHPFLIFVALLCLAVGAGAAGAVNMWFDRDIDAIMRRTCARPLPAGRLDPEAALIYGVLLSAGAVMIMGLALGWLPAALLAAGNMYYIFVYTVWLKRLTPQNIVIGGAAGAFPPIIGWAAVTGTVTPFPLILFAIIFFWTPPHFWALSLFANEDYKRADIPMMTVIKGALYTKWQMLIYTIALFPLGMAPYLLGYTGGFYGAASALLGGFFVFTAWRVLKAQEDDLRPARRMFGYSIFYLFALFAALMIDAPLL